MDKSSFKQAKEFICSDIRREIALAYFSENNRKRKFLEKMGVNPGGGNFLAALGLLCYTEFAGKLRYKVKKKGKDVASANFNKFFDDLGPSYRAFRNAGNNVYSVFRCGLTHEYYVKSNCDISMMKGQAKIGLGKRGNGRLWFNVEKYFKDFKRAFDRLETVLFP